MLATPVLALTTGATIALSLIGGFTLLGLIALGLTHVEHDEEAEVVGYIFGLGKIPRLRVLPEKRNVPATPEPLGSDGLRKVGKNADGTTGFSTERYRLSSGIRRPWKLSADIPDDLEAIEITREAGGKVWVTAQGHLSAAPALDEEETEALEEVLGDVIDPHALRADRRTWSHSTESAEAVNAKRV